MKTPYRILKLRSGEEIITKIASQTKDKLVIERPMIFITRIMIDPYSGKQKELTVLKDWLSNTNEIQTKIPKDFIATFLIPDIDVVELYSLEKEKEDVNTEVRRQIIDTSSDDIKKEMKDPISFSDEKLEEALKMMKDQYLNDPEMLDDMINDEDVEFEDESMTPEMKNFITLTMFLPPEALLPMVQAGMLDPRDIKDLIDSLMNDNHNYNGDDKKRQEEEDFGNSWRDWSPDIKDYFN
tara:strand:- start:2206 stop:2922 length:717 start_codon:yes stop_codon:yes gene_type:complete